MDTRAPASTSNAKKQAPVEKETFAKWSTKQLELLQLEQEQGLAQHELRKIVLRKLQLAEIRIGTFGKTILNLERTKLIGEGSVPTGSPVSVYSPKWGPKEEFELFGVVKSCHEYSLDIVCKKSKILSALQPSSDPEIVVETVPDKTTIKRIRKVLDLPNIASKAHVFARWERVLFGDDDLRFSDEKAVQANANIQRLISSLNESQQNAVSLVLRARDVAVIHGPPGTGKTTTLTKAIESLFELNPTAKLLCCAPSNVAVDNLVGLLSRRKLSLVRLGHPARVSSALQPYTLDAILGSTGVSELVTDAKKEIATTRDFSRRRELQGEIKRREREAVQGIMDQAQVVLATMAGAAELSKLKGPKTKFTHLIVDEAAQAMEVTVLVPLQFLDPSDGVLILAGDHKQLPPTVLSEEASRRGLGSTLMERLVKTKPSCSALLSVQYRMHEDIMSWSSNEMYAGELKADPSVASRILLQLPAVQLRQKPAVEDDDLLGPLVFIDTSGCDVSEKVPADDAEVSESRSNPGEAQLVLGHVPFLISQGLVANEICVVTPYRDQVEAVRSLLSLDSSLERVEVRTVDGFQGQERECVVLSMVRSNSKRLVGFLADERRLNVAITRAKRHVCMIGDSSTLESNPFLARLIKHFEENGSVHSAAEFLGAESGRSSNVPTKQSSGSGKKAQTMTKSAPKLAQQPRSQPVVSSKSKASTVKTITRDVAPTKLSAVQDSTVGPIGFKALAAEDEESDNEAEDQQPISVNDVAEPAPSPNTKAKSKSPSKSGKLAKPKEKHDDGEELAFLEQEAFAATRCGVYPACSKPIDFVSHTCAFCKRKFCMAHCLAEKHGCGSTARRIAQQDNKSGKLPPPKMKAAQRQKVQTALRSKIEAQEKDRAAAVKSKPQKQ